MAIFSQETYENIDNQRKGMGLPGFLSVEAKESFNYLKKSGLPTRKNERYKYTNLSFLNDLVLKEKSNKKELDQPEVGSNCISIINGDVKTNIRNNCGINVYKLSEFSNWPESAQKKLTKKFSTISQSKEPLEALNSLQFKEGIFIDVSNKSEELTLRISFRDHSENNPNGYVDSSFRTYLNIDQQSSLTLLEEFFAEEMFYRNNSFYACLEKGARLNRASLQDDSLNSYSFYNLRIQMERDSFLHNQTLAVGSKLSRNNVEIDILGENAELNLVGAYIIESDQHSDHSTSINHHKGFSVSRETYKGLLNDSSKAVFTGRVYIAQDAQKTDSSQINKNLVLTEKAEVNTKPELEVFADDVKAAHGATVGQLDAEELFYLRSRSIPKAEATKMIAEGFVKEVPMSFPGEEFRNVLLQAASKKLSSFDLKGIS